VKRPPSFSLKITSDIPVASGLGSGAAVSVALIRAVAAFLGRPLPDETVNALAFEAEKIYHGTPSGIDNTVITYARPVYFVRGEPIETLSVPTPFTVVIADSGLASPTAQVVGEVRQRWQAARERYDHVFSEIGHIARQARQAIESGHHETLGGLMDANQFWLQEAGVSSPTLDHLIESAHQAGALGAKLSGAGRGGNIIALVTPQSAPAVARALLDASARHTITTTVR
jgi:mevalonate kinase